MKVNFLLIKENVKGTGQTEKADIISPGVRGPFSVNGGLGARLRAIWIDQCVSHLVPLYFLATVQCFPIVPLLLLLPVVRTS